MRSFQSYSFSFRSFVNSIFGLTCFLFSAHVLAGECKLFFQMDMAGPTTPTLTQEGINQNTIGNGAPAELAEILAFMAAYNAENPVPEIVPANSLEQCVTKVPFAVNLFGMRMRHEIQRQFRVNINQYYLYFLMTAGYYTPGPGLSQSTVPNREGNRYEHAP